MGVYIKGMEMPKDIEPGLVIEFADGIDGKRYARLYHYRHGGLTEWLEAVSVPPHGDLIDRREAIIDANERAYDFWLSDDEVNASIQFLKEQPTIVPADPAEEGK